MDTKSRPWKLLLSGLLAGLLVMGTLAATQPAIAAAPLKWAKIWKQEIKPRADKRYYTKKKSNARYYKKAESNARYAAKPTVIRGVVALGSPPNNVDSSAQTGIDFGFMLTTAPAAHIIAPGAAVPAGCSGTPVAPGADVGHLCIFEQYVEGFSGRFVCSVDNNCTGTAVSRFGALYGAYATSETAQARGSWALGVGPHTTAARVVSGKVANSSLKPAGR